MFDSSETWFKLPEIVGVNLINQLKPSIFPLLSPSFLFSLELSLIIQHIYFTHSSQKIFFFEFSDWTFFFQDYMAFFRYSLYVSARELAERDICQWSLWVLKKNVLESNYSTLWNQFLYFGYINFFISCTWQMLV